MTAFSGIKGKTAKTFKELSWAITMRGLTSAVPRGGMYLLSPGGGGFTGKKMNTIPAGSGLWPISRAGNPTTY
jgi:hypothetical protein